MSGFRLIGDPDSGKPTGVTEAQLVEQGVSYSKVPTYRDFRPGHERHFQADISKWRYLLGYEPSHTIVEGISETLHWCVQHFRQRSG
ncbi:hypothetical protein [Halomonas aquatica]|uniref:NAD dependent epimerase/dehydratase family protein n=1 Tax=Halomonas aquatica TaxID=3151123 RepID=A0ABV1NE60_9GAMM